MKKAFILFVIIAISAGASYSQTSILSIDSNARKIAAVDYLEAANFTYSTALGEATANIVKKCFKESLTIPSTIIERIENVTDKFKLLALQNALQQLLVKAPSWESIVEAEKQRLINEAKAISRTPKYKEE